MLRLNAQGPGIASRAFTATTVMCGLLVATILLTQPAFGSVTVLVGEPFGRFGSILPVGHVAIYLDHLCADGPLKLRACEPGEQQGVVIARYHNIGRIDWVASPILEFLYAVPKADQVPAHVDAEQVWELRQGYRRRYLEAIVPDGKERDAATDEWWETAGVAYSRRLWGYRLDTTAAQDARVMAAMNADPNSHHYRWRKGNCANFAADVVNLYFPGAVHGDRIADFGLMLPKQVARAVNRYGKKHPEEHLQVIEIAQVPGSLVRSHPTRGVAEAGLKSKRYLIPLLVLQPEVPAVLALAYLTHGRWQLGQDATVVGPRQFEAAGDLSTNLAVRTARQESGCGTDCPGAARVPPTP